MNTAGTGFVAVLLIFQCVVLARGEQLDTNEYRINLTGKGTLKDVFDAGLRPKRWASGDNRCFVEDKHITFRVTDNHTATILASYCYFQVYADGSLSSIKAESASLTSEDARKWMLPILAAFGKDSQELDAYLDQMRRRSAARERISSLNRQERSLAVGMPWPGAQSDKPSLGIALIQKSHTERPFQIEVEIEWARPYSAMRSPVGPLQSPLGYEGFPIDTVPYFAEWIRKGEAPPPDVERRYGKEGIQRLRDEYKASKGMTNFPLRSQPPPSPVSASPLNTEPPREVPASTPWPKWLPIGASLAALVGWMVWWRLRSKI